MLQLQSCSRGHFWESAEAEAVCPQCGGEAQGLPLLDLVQTAPPPPALPQPEGLAAELIDHRGRASVAGYDISEDLGRGPTGMRLYKARHKLTGRNVLLEVVLAREDTSQHAWASLRSQAAALARLPYPGIVQLFEVGERERQLFYNALEWVDGPTLREKAAEKPLPAGQIVHLGELLARTVDDAQAHGVLHRGLRPGAILLQPAVLSEKMPERSRPPGGICLLHDDAFYPRLSGYGLVRRATEGEAVDLGLYADEPGYISPEQAWGRAKDLGPHTDVWGLGGILFFLVTGKHPFDGAPAEALERVQGEDVTWPNNINRAGGELAAIIRKCLNRTPHRRYSSAGELADDLRRLALGLPLKCQPDSALYRFGKWLWRNPGVAGMIAVGALGLAGTGYAWLYGSGGSAEARGEVARLKRELESATLRTKAATDEAESLKSRARFTSYQKLVALVAANLQAGNHFRATQIMEAAPAELVPLRGFEWVLLQQQAQRAEKVELPAFASGAQLARISPSGRYAAVVVERGADFRGPENSLRIWHLPSRVAGLVPTENLNLGGIQERGSGRIVDVAFSPSGDAVVAVGGDERAGKARAWSLAEGTTRGATLFERQLFGNGRLVAVGFRGDGREVAAASTDGEVLVLSMLNNGDLMATLSQRRFGGTRWMVLYADQGRVITASPDDRQVVIWDVGGKRQLFQYDLAGSPVALALSQPKEASPTLAVATGDGAVHICDPGRMHIRDSLKDFEGRPVRLAFSPDGKRLAIALDTTRDARFPAGVVELYGFDGANWKPLHKFSAKATHGLSFSASGESLLTAGSREVVIWGKVGG